MTKNEFRVRADTSLSVQIPSLGGATTALFLAMKQNHFELFGLAPRFEIDLAALDTAYRELQGRVHPDRFANADDAQKRVAMQWSTRANEAYQTLKAPLARARYLCELGGVDAQIESNTSMPMDFLMQQLQWREALAEARTARDEDRLLELERDLKGVRAGELAQLKVLIDEKSDLAAAVGHVRQLMFVERFATEVGEALDAVQP